MIKASGSQGIIALETLSGPASARDVKGVYQLRTENSPGDFWGKEDLYDQMPGGNETILLVEDKPLARQAIASVLDSLWYAIIRAPSGKAALDMSKGFKDG